MTTAHHIELFEQLSHCEAQLSAAAWPITPSLSERARAEAFALAESWLSGNVPQRPVVHAPPEVLHDLPLLAAGYRESSDERFALAARRLFDHELAREPWQDEWQPVDVYDVLRIPHRLGDTESPGWFGALPIFLGSAHFDLPFVEQLVASAQHQLQFLLTVLVDGRNIRMTQGDALWTQGYRLSHLPQAEHWREIGLSLINDCLQRLVHADGSSRESAGWYHHIVANMTLRYYLLSQAMPDLNVHTTLEQAAGGIDYTLAMLQPDGLFNRLGDCTAHVTPEATMTTMLDWRNKMRRQLGLNEALPPTVQLFHDVGQAYARSDWSKAAHYLAFDVSERYGYHWHPARNAIQWYVGGQRILADPGRMGYDPTPQRQHVVTTRAHNTMTLNGWNQSETPATIDAVKLTDFHVMRGFYNGGYWPGHDFDRGRGIFGQHHRTLLWISHRLIIVIDHLHHRQHEGDKPDVCCTWQFAPGHVEVREPVIDCNTDEACAITEQTRVLAHHGAERTLMAFPMHPEGMTAKLFAGSANPCAGWVAGLDDQPEPAPVLSLNASAYDPWDAHLVALLWHCRDTPSPALLVEHNVPPVRHEPGYLRFSLDGHPHELWWTTGLRAPIGVADAFTTDASLIYLDLHGRHGLAVDGTSVRPWAIDTQADARTFQFAIPSDHAPAGTP